MATKWSIVAQPTALLMALVVLAGLSTALGARPEEERAIEQVERALVDAAATVSGNIYESPVGQEERQEESYQRVYEAFTKLMQTTTQNSLGNVRRLVARLNRLVGVPQTQTGANGDTAGYVEQQQQTFEDKTEQILERLDRVNRDTDVHTLSKLQEDISKLVATLNNAYLRNIRRVIERVNRLVGSTTVSGPSGSPSLQDASGLLRNQQPDRLTDEQEKVPGFPGWDELLVAVDRMQKSLASFMRSTTRLITSG